ncbi:DNA helicase transcript release factor [Western grey kangaroopox virus]|uniref:DNA helicase transcript release factor n=1 Tax=Western grey kangaroopox virus TaxID=1566307 RepID=A0A2C9DSS3_9POXV|nr:DNA helicase transcript release factor [Western grey kangaroopox virus]ATI21056.1 DNA helicase transcript release factor [Western grey kangaroopox virus]
MSDFTVIDDKLYSALRKSIGYVPLYLFNRAGDFVEVVRRSVFEFLLPTGYFTNLAVPLGGRSFPTGTNTMTDAALLKLPELYPCQRRVIDELTERFKRKVAERRPVYATLHLACGFGKTITASYLIGMHRKRAVVCVPNKMILAQWSAAVHKLGVSCYVSSEGAAKLLRVIDGRDVSVLVVVDKHLANEAFCKLVSRRYDVFVLDEAHTYNLMNLSAMTRFLSFHPPKICYFLTATPRPANSIYCNDVINVTKFSTLQKVTCVIREFYEDFSTASIQDHCRKLSSPQNKYHLYTEKILAEDEPRNRTIVATVAEAFADNRIERALVITKLRKHMLCIFHGLAQELGTDYVFLGDARNRATTETVRRLRDSEHFIFVSTLNYSGTGLDIPRLDTLVVCTSVMNNMQIEQMIGRICRETDSTRRAIYLFPNTSVREIRYTVGIFTQRIGAVAARLGFSEFAERTQVGPASRTQK